MRAWKGLDNLGKILGSRFAFTGTSWGAVHYVTGYCQLELKIVLWNSCPNHLHASVELLLFLVGLSSLWLIKDRCIISVFLLS